MLAGKSGRTTGRFDLLQTLLERGRLLDLDALLVRRDRLVPLVGAVQGGTFPYIALPPARIYLDALSSTEKDG